MELLYDAALWVNELVEQMGMWAFLPLIFGAGLVALKINQSQ